MKPFTKVSNTIIFNGQLSANEKTMIITLLAFGAKKYPSLQVLSKWTGFSQSTVQRVLRGLKKKNVVTWYRGRMGKNNQYKINPRNMWVTGQNEPVWLVTHDHLLRLIIDQYLDVDQKPIQNSEEHERAEREYREQSEP